LKQQLEKEQIIIRNKLIDILFCLFGGGIIYLTSCRREAATICLRPCDLDLLILKVVSESRVTWATFEHILVFLGLSVLDLGPMYATDVRQTDVRQHHLLMGRGHYNVLFFAVNVEQLWLTDEQSTSCLMCVIVLHQNN